MNLLPAPPQTQALSSQTFRPPPLDGSLNIAEIYEWHLKNTPDHRLFVFAREDGTVQSIYWPEVVRAIRVAANLIRSRVGQKSSIDQTPIVGILALSETISYFTSIVGIMRAGYIPFPISPRNSAVAIAHLLNKVQVQHILVGPEQSMQDLANEAINIMKTNHPSNPLPEFSSFPPFQELYLNKTTQEIEDIPYEHRGLYETALILHSSGSTAFPKPIFWSHRALTQMALIPYFGGRDLTGQVISQHAIPMFHGLGIIEIMWTCSSGFIISSYEPKSPPLMPTPDSLLKSARATDCDMIECVPMFIEAWSRNPSHVSWLSTLKCVIYSGGPLNKAIGDFLVSNGVPIYNMYGATETTIMNPVIPAIIHREWEYFRFPDHIATHLMPYGDNLFESVIVSSTFLTPTVINTKINGIDAYMSSDLLVPHPTNRGYYKIYGRVDDQIMHNTGEKTNPGPLEAIINQNTHISASIIFGRGRFQAGILIDPAPNSKFDSTDAMKLAEFRNKIWPTVQKMNVYAPQHSRIFKEMIIVTKPSKPFQHTAKGTPRRQVIIDDYADEIDELYDLVNDSTQTNISPPAKWDLKSTTTFVRAVVNKVMAQQKEDDDDLFQHGCDSLQSTWIRNSILRGLRDSLKMDTREIIENFVYDYPSISRLAPYVTTIASGTTDKLGLSRVSDMVAMVDKYSHDFAVHRPSGVSMPKGDVVLMTGSTGGLGCHLLEQLALDPEISRVYALNRVNREGRSLFDRQRATLIDRGHDPAILDSKKIVLLEGDVAVDNFGLSKSTFDEIQGSVTHVIHNAWPVDFNMSLTSYEPNVRGVRNLIEFCLASPHHEPAKFLFASSIGVFRNLKECNTSELLPETRIASQVAVGNGYPESKWVSEEIIAAAVAQTPIKSVIIRIGQLCAGPTGAWNATDWVPAMVQSATIVGCLPNDDKLVDWMQLPVASKAIIDYRKSQSDTGVVHLVHPKPVPWSSLALAISEELSVPLASYAEWLSRLEQAGVVPQHLKNDEKFEMELHKKIPALRMQPFFRGIAKRPLEDTNLNAFGFPKLAVAQGVMASSTLSDPQLEMLSRDDVKRWLAYWRRVGLLK